MASRNVTMVDVAKRAGVSHTTVSEALRGTGRISKARVEQIKKIANEMGFHPSLAAKLLRGNKTDQLGLILVTGEAGESAFEKGNFGNIVYHFVNACEDVGQTYHIEGYSENVDNINLPRQFAGGVVDGALVVGYSGKKLREKLCSQKCHFVSIDERSKHCVLLAADVGVYEAVKHQAALGHERIADIGGGSVKYLSHRLGREGFEKAADDFNLDTNKGLWVKNFESLDTEEIICDAIEWTNKMLKNQLRPTAFICHSMENVVIHVARTLGLRIPEDLSITGFGTRTNARRYIPELTHIEPDYKTMIYAAVAMLRKIIAGNYNKEETILVQPKLVVRNSSGSLCDRF